MSVWKILDCKNICALRIASIMAAIVMGGMAQASQPPSKPAVKDPAPAVDLVVSGAVIERREIWDRRTNPLMGRPDFLREILLKVDVSKVVSGRLTGRAMRVEVSIKGQEKLVEFRKLVAGWRGTFGLMGGKSPYEMAYFRDGVAPKAKPRIGIVPPAGQSGAPLKFPENLTGKQVRESRDLRERALKEITGRYGMTESSVVTLTSHQGPMPPEGGYVFWGVKGRVSGKWHIWQGGYGLRPGTELEDPQRYQK
jgi:hypothetical protein